MADNKPSQSKTEPPTPKRLRDLRRKGQVAKSRDVPATAVLVAGGILLMAAGGLLCDALREIMERSVSFDFRTIDEPATLVGWTVTLLRRLAGLTLPPVLLLAAVSALVSFLEVGPVFSTDPVKPQLARINPIEGIRRIFSLATAVELLKLLLKTLALALLLWMLAMHWLPQLLRSHWLPVADILPLTGALFVQLVWIAVACFIATTAFDVWFQHWHFRRLNRMTFEEVRREHKET
ncbi:MAG TPA: EscU/YscU/HrcU family type III secretion system export apparatus switch protein, partial [Povalibacter sp.]|nr:EscU/YscU/HrcU family type III secretion system export apparatus switch protein [Povalibacter sp.]